ncbi:MAG: LuxR C-terminal-related transcriptional regulator [Acidimicrobiia bacterium]|nr:LuxR C-terminal-related transcriptional regulator [Acidimicrobiia bacterium]
MSRPLVVIVAAAGSGKTVLASHWEQRRSERDELTGWLSLDAGDNDPPRFWRYFAAAVSAAVGGLPAPIEREIAAPTGLRPDERLGGLIDHLTTTDTKAVVVLDDFHHVTDASIREQLAFLLDNCRSSLCLVVLSRGQPQLPMAKLRSRGLLAEITTEDLALTVEETTEVLGRELSTLDVHDAERLHERTEGWAVGVYLAALSLATHEAPSEFIADVSGDEQVIVDYLAAELLSGLTDDERRFLYRTSIVDRFCAPLCAAVTGQADAAQILDRLARANCLIVSLDQRRYWHRYHHLFAEFLRSEVERWEPEAVPDLHHRAATWFADQRLDVEATGHAIAARQWDLAARIIARCWEEQRDRGARAVVVEWLNGLPPDLIESEPALLLARSWTWLYVGRLDETDQVHGRLSAMVEGPKRPSADVTSEFLVSRATVRLLRGDTGRALDDATEAAHLEQEGDRPNTGRALTLVGAALFWRDPTTARTALTNAVELTASSGHHGSTLQAQGYLAALEEEPELAEVLANGALARAAEVGWRFHFLTSMPHLVLARCRRLDGRYEGARTELDTAIELARRAHTPLRTAYCMLELAEQEYLRDGPVRDTMTEIRRLTADCADPGRLTDLVAQASARFRLPPPSSLMAQPLLPDPLTERELAVLTFLASELTQREIAEALFVSTNTVKTHVQAIYRTLAVTARGAAIRQAIDLDLLPTSG